MAGWSDGMRPGLGINTYSYIWSTTAEACVRRLSDLGYTEFELVLNPPHLSIDLNVTGRRRLRSAAEEAGARLVSLNLPSLDCNLASSMRLTRDYSVGVYKSAIELAADLGIRHLITVPGRISPLLPPEPSMLTGWLSETLDHLQPYAESLGVGLALENVPFASLPHASALAAYIRERGEGVLSACYDAANSHFVGESPDEALGHLAGLVSVVHLSDTTRTAWRHDPVGLGDVPFLDVARAIGDHAPNAPCMLEIIDAEPESAIVCSHERLAKLGYGAPPGEIGAVPSKRGGL